MNDFFPLMSDKLENRQKAIGWLYWFVYLIFLPMVLMPLMIALFDDPKTTWIPFAVFFAVNLLFVLCTFGGHLIEEWTYFRFYLRENLKKMVLPAIILGVLFLAGIIYIYAAGPFMLVDANEYLYLPASDTLEGLAPSYVFILNPVVFFFVMILVVPVTTACLYYAVGFSTFSANRPWLGYLAVIMLTALYFFFSVYRGYLAGTLESTIFRFCSALVFHCIACWTYQRCDNIWPAILLHAVVNLCSVLFFALFSNGSI